MVVIGSAYVLICFFHFLLFLLLFICLKFEGSTGLFYSMYMSSRIFILCPLRLSPDFKLSLVIMLHAVACCPVSCANNCSFVGSR